MSNERTALFDDDSQSFLVLVNAEEQHSLWPQSLVLPAGWQPVFGPASRSLCDSWLEENWTDIRPLSLRQA